MPEASASPSLIAVVPTLIATPHTVSALFALLDVVAVVALLAVFAVPALTA